MPQETPNSGSESYLPDLWEALKEFAMPEDLTVSNKPVYKIDEEGLKRTCFRRGNFTPSGKSEIAKLLRDYEEGNDSAMSTISAMLEGLPISIRMEINEQPINGGKRMLIRIILVCREDIFRVLKFSPPS